MAGAVGAILSLAASTAVWNREDGLAAQELIARGNSYHLAMQFGIDAYLSKVEALRALFDATKSVNCEEFEEFSAQILKNQTALRGMAWLPRVTAQERDAHERAAVTDGLVGYQIKSIAPDGSLVAAPSRDEYFPLLFTVLELREARGLNLKDAARQRSSERARDIGQMATGADFTLAKHAGDQTGFFVVLPIYRPGAPHDTVEDRRKNLIGFVYAGFQTNAFLEAIVNNAATVGGLNSRASFVRLEIASRSISAKTAIICTMGLFA